MTYIFRKLKWYLCLRFPRFKLYCIRRALKLEPRRWQTAFALGRDNWLPLYPGRASGKTVAVMLRLLMQHPAEAARYDWLYLDPDYLPSSSRMDRWYRRTYLEMARTCRNAGIPVPAPFELVKL